MHGFLNLHKPLGLTSHDCVAKVRRLVRSKRVGHGGTLDPAASGVLPIAVGKATRLLQFLPEGKAYRATVRFGVQTTTDDLAGEVIRQLPTSELTLEAIEVCLPRFIGKIRQIPPRYSAIQVGGKRLYDLARAGEVVEVPERTVEIFQIQILDWRSKGTDLPELDLAIDCGAGTYIRSIARDLGAMVGTGGTLAALCRTYSSGFSLDKSLTLDQLAAAIEAGQFQPLPPDLALQHLDLIPLPIDLVKRWRQGQKLAWAELGLGDRAMQETSDRSYRVCVADSHDFLGIGHQVLATQGLILVPKLVWDA